MISVVIPSYNSALDLRQCLAGLKQQDCKEKFEVIVVDDGSSDNTKEIVESIGVKYFFVKHAGPVAARNFGVENSSGEIVLFTDADCIPKENWIAEMVKPFSDESVAGVRGRYESGQTALPARYAQLEYESKYERMKDLKRVDFIDTSSAAFRKNVLQKYGSFDSSFPAAACEDTELSYRLSSAGLKLVYNPNAVVVHRHNEYWLEYFHRKFNVAYWRVLLYKKHPEKMLGDSHTPQVLKLQIPLSLLVLLTLLYHLNSGLLLPLAVALILFSLSALPFALWAFKRDSTVGLISIPVAYFRSLAYSIGLFSGLIHTPFSHNPPAMK